MHWFLKPILFENPRRDQSSVFVERSWLYTEISSHLTENGGVIISGASGTGKTDAIWQIVDNSCFSQRNSIEEYQSNLERLSRQVVAYHFCQVDDVLTCRVANMVHSIAAQMTQAPSLEAYKQLLSTDQKLRSKLSLSNCEADPDIAFIDGILLPLKHLQEETKIENGIKFILIDAICDSQMKRQSYGDSIITFLAKHSDSFPSWLKLVISIRT